MTRWTEDQLTEYLCQFHKPAKGPDAADPGLESILQGKVERWCKDHGYPCLSFRQTPAARKILPPGWPDVIIVMPRSRVVFIELKSKRGRLSDAQKGVKAQFSHLGHTLHEVRSYKSFLDLVKTILYCTL